MQIAIMGNCQAQILEGLFQFTGIFEVDRLPPVFQMTEASKTQTLAKLSNADFIFAQRVSEDYPLEWSRGSFLRYTFGDRCFTWPNIYFDGYFPGTQYVYLPQWGKLQGPLDDYHLEDIIQAFRGGLSIADAVRQFGEPREPEARPFEASIKQLQDREEDCDIIISDYLKTEAFTRQCFYTPNHPDNMVLQMMAERLACAAGIDFDQGAFEGFKYRLDRVMIRPFPSVVTQYKLNFDAANPSDAYVCRGLEVGSVSMGSVELGQGRYYLLPELIEQFYRVYDVAMR